MIMIMIMSPDVRKFEGVFNLGIEMTPFIWNKQ